MIDVTTILYAIALQNSPYCNSSRTEDVTHASWAATMSGLCQSLSKNLLPTPQFKVYVPSQDSSFNNPFDSLGLDLDLSIKTQTDKKGEGVITDFCVLMPLIVRKGPDRKVLRVEQVAQEIEELVRGGYSGIPFEHFLVPRMYIPVLVELKRPLSRHFSSVRTYVNNLDRGFDFATNQVKHQAACLFSTPKYAYQKYVILVAAVGEWWTMCVASRRETAMFDIDDFNMVMEKVDELEPTGNAITDSKLRALDDQDWDENAIHEPTDIHSVVDRELRKAQELEKEREDEINRIREEDEKKSKTWAGNDPPKKKMADFLKKTEPRYLSEEKLKEFYKLNKESDGREYLFKTGGELPEGPVTKDTLLDRWTPPLRVGSVASNFYMSFIRDELRTAGDLYRF